MPNNKYEHGTINRYKGGCRCDDCRAVNADYQRSRRRSPKCTSAGAVNVMLLDLLETMTKTAIMKETHLCWNTLNAILNEHGQKRIRKVTYGKIRALWVKKHGDKR